MPRADPQAPRGGATDVALAVATRGGRALVARRAAGTHLAGAWEFPGGKLVPGETPPDGARRELLEETRLEADALEPLGLFVYEYPDRSLRFHVFLAREPRGDVRLDGEREWAWKSWEELSALEMPPANAPIVSALRWRLA